MSVSGLCEICQHSGVEGTCDRCGKLVCEEHYDASAGVCAECLQELGRGDTQDPETLPDGVDTYQF